MSSLKKHIYIYIYIVVCFAPWAGAMVYVCLHELLVESMEQLGFTKAVLARHPVGVRASLTLVHSMRGEPHYRSLA